MQVTASKSGVTKPMTATSCPSTSSTVEFTTRPNSTRAAIAGSAEKSRLMFKKGGSEFGNKPMNEAKASGHKSNSWFPMHNAS